MCGCPIPIGSVHHYTQDHFQACDQRSREGAEVFNTSPAQDVAANGATHEENAKDHGLQRAEPNTAGQAGNTKWKRVPLAFLIYLDPEEFQMNSGEDAISFAASFKSWLLWRRGSWPISCCFEVAPKMKFQSMPSARTREPHIDNGNYKNTYTN